MKSISSKDGDLLSQFDNINEDDIPILSRIADLPPQFQSTPHQKILIHIHTDVKKGKIKGYSNLEDIFGFSRSIEKVTKNLGFHLMLKTDLQDNIYTSMADENNVTIINLYLYVPNLIPSVETKLMFNEATQNKYRISYDEYCTERRLISDMITQAHIGSAQQVSSPEYLIGAHQTLDGTDAPNKNNAIFDHLNSKKNYVEIDGQRYPRDNVLINYEENDYIERYKNLKLFFKEYIGEVLLEPFLTYPNMRTKYPIEILDLRHQSDHITHKQIQFLEEYGLDPANARLFLILIRRREIELISDGDKLIDVKVIPMKILNFKDFMKKYFKKRYFERIRITKSL